MKPKNIPSLLKNKTLLFLSTKNFQHKDYKYTDRLIFKKESEESILNDYPLVAFAFHKIIGIPSEAINLSNVNLKLFELVELIQPKIFQRVLEDINHYDFVSTGDTTNQAIFKTIYGYLQAIQVKKLNKEDNSYSSLVILDESLVKK